MGEASGKKRFHGLLLVAIELLKSALHEKPIEAHGINRLFSM
jgi:hypothetical protein